MEDRVVGFVWVRRVQRVLSRIILGLSGLSISGSPLMGLSLNPSISLSLCFRRKEKEERVIRQEEEKGGRSVWRNRERRENEEKKRIIKIRMRNNI
jgi:hypothetical protein